MNRHFHISAVTLWVLVCALLSLAGWVLSALHQLNVFGYGCVLGGAAVIAGLNWKHLSFRAASLGRLRRRFSRLFPLAFLILATLAILGGAIHPPANYDALAYRIPRVLHWLAAERWHWIPTEFQRLNVRACGFEWVAAPLIALSRTDRLLFVINAISFLLLPGLFFSVSTRLGIRPRVAWTWMWILPTGYCFLLQAGSAGNDLFGAVFALAAVDFALRAQSSGRITDIWLSIFAAALLSGSKSSNLPLLLPWVMAIAPVVPLLSQRLFRSSVVLVTAAASSLLPTMILNHRHCGDWTGLAVEYAQFHNSSPSLNLPVNTLLLTLQNFVPPVFPIAEKWNSAVLRTMPTSITQKLEAYFEPGAAHFTVGQMDIEETAGLGFGVSCLMLITVVASLRGGKLGGVRSGWQQSAVMVAPYISFATFMAKSGLSAAARLVTPYYLLLLPCIISRHTARALICAKWWRLLALAVFGVALAPLILSPPRPLWPAQTFLKLASAETSTNSLLRRAHQVYSVYGQRSDSFAPARDALPAGLRVLGVVTFDDPEASLWRPFGSRRIEHVTRADTAQTLRARGVEYVLVNPEQLPRLGKTIEDLTRALSADVIREIPLTLRATSGTVNWYLLKLPPPN